MLSDDSDPRQDFRNRKAHQNTQDKVLYIRSAGGFGHVELLCQLLLREILLLALPRDVAANGSFWNASYVEDALSIEQSREK